MQKKRQRVTPVHQTAVQAESLYFHFPRRTCRGSGREKTSMGRLWPSLGSRDAVRANEAGSLVGGGGGCLRETLLICGWKISGGGSWDSYDEEEGEGEGDLDGLRGVAWCASQPFGDDSGDSDRPRPDAISGVDCEAYREPPCSWSSSSKRK